MSTCRCSPLPATTTHSNPCRHPPPPLPHTAYGLPSHSGGEYDEALTQLSMVRGSGPLTLLGLFPSLVPEKFRGQLPEAPPVAAAAAVAGGGAADSAGGLLLGLSDDKGS